MAPLGDWDPLQPAAVQELLAELDVWWCLSGGWALDLLLGHETRAHGDTDVTVLRSDTQRVREHLSAWDLHVADPPGVGTLREWHVGSELGSELHDVWCRRTSSDPWCLQLMINEIESGEWIYRRDGRIRRPIETLAGRA